MAKSRRERVHTRLAEADGEWVCSRTLSHPQIGGRRLAARVYELRVRGVAVETRTCGCVQCHHSRLVALRRNEPPTRLAAYRLVAEPAQQAAS